jgi:hypothetical protein
MDIGMEVLTDLIMHKIEVSENLKEVESELNRRGIVHDKSKFLPIEHDAFVKTRPDFKKANYGTPEYQKCIEAIQPSIDHHYSNNRHHVAYHENGFSDMNLIDILEMLADWKAANRRSPDLNFEDSLPSCYKKYNIPENMQKHIEKTLKYLGWI